MMSAAERRAYNPVVETLPREDLEQLQWVKLQRLLARLHAGNGFYRQKFEDAGVDVTTLRSLDEFSKVVPTTTKQELVADQDLARPFGLRLGVSPDRLAIVATTGGTSGIGQEVHGFTANDLDAYATVLASGCYWAGLRPGDVVANTLTVSVSAAGQLLHRTFTEQRVVSLSVGPYDTDTKLEMILRFGARAVVGTPSYLRRLQHTASDHGIDLANGPVEILLTATESFSVDWVRNVEEAWGAQLFEWYGTTQRLAAWTCELGALHGARHGALHVLPHLTLIEVVDPEKGTHVAPGEEGEIVGTFLDSEASPLVRFASGDRARYLGWSSCGCGRALPAIESGTITRYDDMLKIKGVNLWPASVDEVLLTHPAVDDYRGRVFLDDRLRERAELLVRFRPHIDRAARAGILSELAGRVRQRVGLHLQLEEADQLDGEFTNERSKARRWRDERSHKS